MQENSFSLEATDSTTKHKTLWLVLLFLLVMTLDAAGNTGTITITLVLLQ